MSYREPILSSLWVGGRQRMMWRLALTRVMKNFIGSAKKLENFFLMAGIRACPKHTAISFKKVPHQNPKFIGNIANRVKINKLKSRDIIYLAIDRFRRVKWQHIHEVKISKFWLLKGIQQHIQQKDFTFLGRVSMAIKCKTVVYLRDVAELLPTLVNLNSMEFDEQDCKWFDVHECSNRCRLFWKITCNKLSSSSTENKGGYSPLISKLFKASRYMSSRRSGAWTKTTQIRLKTLIQWNFR